MATEFTSEEAQGRLTELLDRAEAGEEIVITRFGVPCVRLQLVRERETGSGVRAGAGALWLGPVVGDISGGDTSEAHRVEGPHDEPGTFDMGTDYWPGWNMSA